MLRHTLLIIAIACLPYFGNLVVAQTAYQKTYDRAWDFGSALEILPNGELILGGNTENPDVNDLAHLWFQKTDPQGNPIWTKSVLNAGRLYVTDFQLMPGGDVLVAYAKQNEDAPTQNYGGFCRLATDGTLLWSKQLSEGSFLGRISSTQNGFLLTGYKLATNGFKDALVVKLDQDGGLLWTKTFGAPKSDEAEACWEDPLGFIYCVGYTLNADGNRDGFLIKMNDQGDFVWTRAYQSLSGDDRFVGIVQANDNRLLLIGSSTGYGTNQSEVWAVQTDFEGNIKWSRTYAVTNEDHAAWEVKSLQGYKALICINRVYASVGNYAVLLQINGEGDQTQCTRYKTNGELDFLHQALQAPDGSLAAIGSANRNGISDIWLMRAGSDGDIPHCCPQSFQYERSDAAIEVINYFPTVGASVQVIAAALVLSDQDITTLSPCKVVNLDFEVTKDTLCPGDCLSVNFPNPTPGIGYSWVFQGGTPSASPVAQPSGLICFDKEGFVTLHAQGACPLDTSIRIAFPPLSDKVPNIFTPNGDGLNDRFRPIINDCALKNYHLMIYSRWGELVFESFQSTESWDAYTLNGSQAAPDVYAWQVSFTSIKDGKEVLVSNKGDVTLIR